jgi:hypothetical protein
MVRATTTLKIAGKLLANPCCPLDLVPEWVAKIFETLLAHVVERQH